jgi:hypothetical protein
MYPIRNQIIDAVIYATGPQDYVADVFKIYTTVDKSMSEVYLQLDVNNTIFSEAQRVALAESLATNLKDAGLVKTSDNVQEGIKKELDSTFLNNGRHARLAMGEWLTLHCLIRARILEVDTAILDLKDAESQAANLLKGERQLLVNVKNLLYSQING